MTLPEDDVEVFKIYQTWLNTTQLRFNFDNEEWWLRFTKLWIFADKIGSTSLKNNTVDAIVLTIRCNPHLTRASPNAVAYTYEHTSDRSPLIDILIKHFIIKARQEHVSADDLESYPHRFLSEVAFNTVVYVPDSTYWKSSVEYHRECIQGCCKGKPSGKANEHTSRD